MVKDPALFTLCGVIVTTLGAILVELIRARRKNEDVKQEVVSTKESVETAAVAADSQLVSLARDVSTIKERLDDHIRWHLEASPFVYLGRRDNR